MPIRGISGVGDFTDSLREDSLRRRYTASGRAAHYRPSEGGSSVGRLLDAVNPTFTCSLLAVASIVLIVGHKDGIYLTVPVEIALLGGGVAMPGSSSSGLRPEDADRVRTWSS
jgi:hypothetical protein